MEGRDRFLLGLQYVLGQIAIVVTAPLCFLFVRLMGYRIRDLKHIRNEVRRMYRAHEGPWIVCPNHLTLIDSLVVSYGMASLADHILHFRRIPWNLPERKNFQRNLFVALLCYLAKCLPVDRGGSREDLQRLLEKCCRVLNWGQGLMIFPEGGRSRTGRVNRESFSYGVGRFVEECSRCRVMLVYLRGDGQQTYGTIPRFGERFTMIAEVFDPGRTTGGGSASSGNMRGGSWNVSPHWRMPALPPVGNDIVDLAAPCNLGKSGDSRFCSRVFTAEEQALIAKAQRPDALLWALWAAKEAAYKAVSRGDPAVGSIPRKYRVVLAIGNAAGNAARLDGKVITPRGEMALRIALTADCVHALAAATEADIERLCRRMDRLKGTGGDVNPSFFIRGKILREIARRLGCPVGDLSVVKDTGGPGVPRILFRGRLLAAEVSLSHDGRFTAYAFDPATLIPAEPGGRVKSCREGVFSL